MVFSHGRLTLWLAALFITLSSPAWSSIDSPSHAPNGTYTVTYIPDPGADSHELYENGVLVSTSTPYGVSNKPLGQYTYRLKTCQSFGSGINFCTWADENNPVVYGPSTTLVSAALENVTVRAVISETGNEPGWQDFNAGVRLSRGDATISVPVATPAGASGVGPSLSLRYNSGGARDISELQKQAGILGYGWSVGGLSEIRRCQVGGVVEFVSMTDIDRLCLDGERLVQVSSGGYWDDGAEYRSESQRYVRVKAKGTGTLNRWFQVETSDGFTRNYGDTADSYFKAVNGNNSRYIWGLTTSVDGFNNQMVVNYHREAVSGTSYPLSITYGAARVDFNYEIRPDVNYVQTNPIATEFVTTYVALHTILVKMNGKKIREYRLENNEFEAAYVLDKIQECGYNEDGTSSKCLDPIEMTWEVLPTEEGDIRFVVNEVKGSMGEVSSWEYYLMDGDGTSNHSLHHGGTSWFGTKPLPYNVSPREVDDKRGVVKIFRRPSGRAYPNDTVVRTDYRYKGYPLYHDDGRGFSGFPATVTYEYSPTLHNRVAGNGTSTNTTLWTAYQHHMGFPFIGRLARKLPQVWMPEVSKWIQRPRAEYGWDAHSMLISQEPLPKPVYFPYLRRKHDRWLERNASNAHNSYASATTDYEYSFKKENGSNCTSGSSVECFVGQKTTTTRRGISLGAQDFGTVWGQVGYRGVAGPKRFIEQTTDFTNDVSNWVLGFASDITTSHGLTSATESYSAVSTKHSTASLRPGSVERFPGHSTYRQKDTMSYDGAGNLTSIAKDGATISNRTTSLSNYLHNLYPQTLINAKSQASTLAYDLRFGAPKSTTDVNGQITTSVYDEFGRPTRITYNDGAKAEFTYEDCSGTTCNAVTWAKPALRITTTFKHGSTERAPDQRAYLDVNQNVVMEETMAFAAADGWSRVETHRNRNGSVKQTSLPFHCNSTTCPSVTRYYTRFHYDEKGRVALTVKGDDSTVSNDFWATYGELNLEVIESSSDNTKLLKYNPLSEVSQVFDDYAGPDEADTTYTYTVRGQLNTVTVDGTQVTDMDYDIAGNRYLIDELTSGITTFGFDSLNQNTVVIDALGNLTAYNYDALGRTIQRVDGWQSSEEIINTFQWDSAPNGVGSLHYIQNPYQTEIFSYDGLGRLFAANGALGAPEAGAPVATSYAVGYAYDPQGRLNKVTYPNNVEIEQTFDRGYPNQTKKGTLVLEDVYAVDAFGGQEETHYGHGLQTKRLRAPETGRLTHIQTGSGSGESLRSVQDLEYKWRANGSLNQRIDHRGTDGTADDLTETFLYDGLNRLEDASAGINGSVHRQKVYDYDVLGNITQKTSSVSGDLDVDDYSYDFVGGSNMYRLDRADHDGVQNDYAYDSNGNVTLIERPGDDTYISYDRSNRATKITVGSSGTTTVPAARDEFWYGPTGDRVARKASWMESGSLKVSWTSYLLGGALERIYPLYDGSVIYRDLLQVTSTVRHRYVKYPSSSATSVEYVHRDHLGSVDKVTGYPSAERNLAFDPFGGRREADDWISDITQAGMDQVIADSDAYGSRGFTDHEHLNRTGIIHMNGRVYDARIGRFLQPDIYVPKPLDTQSYNRYAYVRNQPLSLSDPTGFWGCEGDCSPPPGFFGDGLGPLITLVPFEFYDLGLTEFLEDGDSGVHNNFGDGFGNCPVIGIAGCVDSKLIGSDGSESELTPEQEALVDPIRKIFLEKIHAVDVLGDRYLPEALEWLRPLLRGTLIHKAVENTVKELGGVYDAEISYKLGKREDYGTPGSIRVDVTVGPISRPYFVIELKTGKQVQEQVNTKKFEDNLPPGTGLIILTEGAVKDDGN